MKLRRRRCHDGIYCVAFLTRSNTWSIVHQRDIRINILRIMLVSADCYASIFMETRRGLYYKCSTGMPKQASMLTKHVQT